MSEMYIDKILAPYVKHVWSVSNENIGNRTLRLFADGYPGLMFQHGKNGLLLDNVHKLDTLFVYGQTVKPIALSSPSDFKAIVFVFHPHVINSLFKLQANELSDTCVDVKLLSKKYNDSLEDKLINEPHEKRRIELLKKFLAKHIVSINAQVDEEMNLAVNEISKSEGNNMIRNIRSTLRISERTFERRFVQHVGVPPKLYSSICRFRKSFDKLQSGQYNKLSDIAFDSGFADQAHYIRFFKRFTGETPGRLHKISNVQATVNL